MANIFCKAWSVKRDFRNKNSVCTQYKKQIQKTNTKNKYKKNTKNDQFDICFREKNLFEDHY